MKLFGFSTPISDSEPAPAPESTKKPTVMMLKNVIIGGGLGVASGYSYHKYTQMASVGFGVGFFATQMKKRAWTILDLNGDGKVDLDDVEVIEDKLHFQITLIGIGAFACGFGGGYLVGFW
jgi:uncharacterized membrane protein (Fun14 family)